MMAESGYLLAIRDNFESLLSKSVFSIVETQMKSKDLDLNVKNRIFSVIVECVQNICATEVSHSTDKNSILLLNKIENGHNIVVGTSLKEDRKLRLNSLLEELNSMNTEQLKQKRKELLSQKSDLDEVMRENLATVDLFIRSEGKIKYYYEDYKGEQNFLVLEIEISNN